MTDGRGTMGDSEWEDQCRRWTGNRNGMKGGGGSRGHRLVGGGGGGGTGLVPEGGRAGVGGLVTDTWVVSEGCCTSAVSGDLRSGAPHTHYLYYYYCCYVALTTLLSIRLFRVPQLNQQCHNLPKRCVSCDYMRASVCVFVTVGFVVLKQRSNDPWCGGGGGGRTTSRARSRSGPLN